MYGKLKNMRSLHRTGGIRTLQKKRMSYYKNGLENEELYRNWNYTLLNCLRN